MTQRPWLIIAVLLTPGLLQAQDPDAVGEVTASSLWSVIQAGGIFMVPLAILSVIALALILVFFFTLRRSAIVTARYMTTADALLRKGDFLGLLAVSNRHNEAIARVMQRMLDFVTKNPKATYQEAREIAETEGTRQSSVLSQQIVYLADIGTLSPMLGLLGTVVGMIKSFSVMATNAVATRPTLPAEGVAEALITTAAGLIVAVPAMAAYAYFRGKVQSLVADLEGATTQLMALFAASFRKSRPASADLEA